MKQNKGAGNSNPTPQEQWKQFLLDLGKRKPNPPKFYDVIKYSQLKKIDQTSITLIFPTQEEVDKAKQQWQKIQNELPPNLKRRQIYCVLDTPEEAILESPLQVLKFKDFEKDKNGKELVKSVLEAVEEAEESCSPIYKFLSDRISTLAHKDGILEVEFPWRVHVGGMRGFRDLLLPAMHPIYGIPYIPASSLKGAIKAWAKKNNNTVKMTDIDRTLGYLEGDSASVGTVQILDAFPTEPCLALDIANPQWKWEGERVKYGSNPHHLLSMEKPKLLIGITLNSYGLNHQNDVQLVKQWLQQALSEGVGSRVSTGYGRLKFETSLRCSSQHEFQLWTQGIYGVEPPSKDNKGIPEFRSTALRGVLRYWFRAIALGLLSPQECKTLEGELFGALEPKTVEGSLRIGIHLQDTESNTANQPYFYQGKIFLEAREQQHLKLIEKILQLSSLLAGIGRGARRPLHRNNGRFRGCYWHLNNFQLVSDQHVWQRHLNEINELVTEIQPPEKSPTSSEPGTPEKRYQDVFDQNSHIYLVPCPGMIHPKDVRDWTRNVSTPPVLGKALKLLYSSDRYKGGEWEISGDVREGNPWVGGKLEIPSFVVIKSNFPKGSTPYQTVTIFGVNQKYREAFAQELQRNYDVFIVEFPIS